MVGLKLNMANRGIFLSVFLVDNLTSLEFEVPYAAAQFFPMVTYAIEDIDTFIDLRHMLLYNLGAFFFLFW